MNGFTYHNIFETKGIEYLVVIAFLLLLIPFWIMLTKRSAVSHRVRKNALRLSEKSLKIPQGILFNRNHSWTYLTMSGIARVGLDDLLMHITGDVRFTGVREAGEKVKKGEFLTEIMQEGKTLRVYSPISGEIVAANPVLKNDPALVYEDPYGAGWVYKIRPSNWTEDTRSCFLAGEATSWFSMELQRFRDFLAGTASSGSEGRLVLQDGGEITDQPLSGMPSEVWNHFQQDFLDPMRG
jgi:glycine cleavage system H protein